MCGLVGFCPNNKSKINILRFKTLLLYNESRGKLSTGIWNIDGLKKEVINATTFSKDQQWHDLHKNSIFMGHTRQPTLGYPTTLNGAQPMEQDNIVMIHNGSIYNKDALAEKYNVELEENDTDSKVMSKILNNKDFEVLNDYKGAAALIWIYKDDPTSVYYYKGASNRSDYTTITEDERPLFRVNTKEGIYLSSIEESLSSITLSKTELESITSVPENKVFKINSRNPHKLEIIYEVDRKESQSSYTKPTNTSKSYNRKNNKHIHSNNNNKSLSLYDALADDYWGIDFFNSDQYDEYKVEKTEPYNLSNEKTLITKLVTARGHGGSDVFNDVKHDIEDEEVNRLQMDGVRIYYNKGRYWYLDRPAMGTFKVKEDGSISTQGTLYSFVRGILLKDSGDYIELRDKINEDTLAFGTIEFAATACLYSNMPIPYYNWEYYGIYFGTEQDKAFSGTYQPIFLNRGIYNFQYGYFREITKEKKEDKKSPFKIEGGSPSEDDTSGPLDLTVLGDMQLEPEDIVKLRDDSKIKILTLYEDNFIGRKLGTQVTAQYEYFEVIKVVIENESLDAAIADEHEVGEIILEAIDDFRDTLVKLADYEDNDKAIKLSKNIEEFVKINFIQ